jgi:hypothetical protein
MIALSSPRAFLASCVLVALATALFPFISGYGTQLFQAVALGAWSLVAAATSNRVADLNHFAVWAVAAVLTLVLFAVPAAALLLVTRRRWPAASASLVIVWLVFYIASLFVLFRATDGP